MTPFQQQIEEFRAALAEINAVQLQFAASIRCDFASEAALAAAEIDQAETSYAVE
jgi:hypothetical protein